MRRLILAILIFLCSVSTSFAYRSVYSETVRDSVGNIMAGATVRVYLQNTGVAATIYETLASASSVSSVVTSSDGSFILYLDHFDYDSDQTFKIVVTRGTSTKTYEDVTMNRAVNGTYTGNHTLTTHITVPKGVLYSGTITVTTGSLQAGYYQIFTGSGTVTGLSEAVPDWWYSGSGGWQAAVTAALASTNGTIWFGSGTYSFTDEMIWTNANVKGVPGRTVFQPSAAVSGTFLSVNTTTNTNTGYSYPSVIEGISIDGTLTTSVTGIKPGATLSGNVKLKDVENSS